MKYWIVLTTQVGLPRIVTDNPIASSIIAICMVLFSSLYGPSEMTRAGMALLILLIVIDWVAGFSAAKKDQIDTSSYGIEGLFRTMILLLLPAVAHFIDIFFYTQGFASYFMIAALARHLLKSVVANIYRVGWTKWIPVAALDRLSNWASDEIKYKDARAKQRYEDIYGKDGET